MSPDDAGGDLRAKTGGAVFSAAIAARLAHGDEVLDALAYAKGLVARAIQDAADWRIGSGPGPIDVCG